MNQINQDDDDDDYVGFIFLCIMDTSLLTDEDEFVVVIPPIFLCIHAGLQIRSYKIKPEKRDTSVAWL